MKNAHTATARGTNLEASRKHSIEIANAIRGKDVVKVKKFLGEVLKKKTAVPFKRFNRDLGHKRGRIAAGRYPEKATKEILGLIASAEANAENKGLNTESLRLSEIVINKGTTQWRYGRQKRRQAKRTHIEVTLVEKEETKKDKKQVKETPKVEEKKEEVKKETVKEKPKEEKPVKEETKKETPKKEEKTEEKKK